jgi:Fe-S cluster assembly protein SufD
MSEDAKLLSRRLEAWRYVDVDLLNKHPRKAMGSGPVSLELAELSVDGADHIFIANGVVDWSQSHVSDWEGHFDLEASRDALPPVGDVLAQRVESCLKFNISKSAPKDKVLQIIVAGGGDGVEARSGVVVDVPALVECAFVLSAAGEKNEHWANHRWHFSLGDGAQVKAVALHQTPAEVLLTNSVSASLQRDCRCWIQCLSSPTALVRHHLDIDFYGENAEVYLSGCGALGDGESVHHQLELKHRVPNCFSSQSFKVSLDGKSRASFDGMIEVSKGADGTDAHQLNRYLVLSDEARASGKPQLKIYAHDVSCAHGSTTGSLDDEELFYLSSRGLSKAAGEALLSRGFVEEVLQESPILAAAKWYREHHVMPRLGCLLN